MSRDIKFSLGFKFSMLVMVISLFIGALLIFSSYQLHHQNILNRYEAQGQALAATVAEVVDWDKVDHYFETGETDDAYWETLEKMRLCTQAASAEYLFVLKPHENGCSYIFDTDDSSDCYNLGDSMNWYEAFGEYADELERGEQIKPIFTNEEFGWLLSVYVPYENSEGEFVGYLGVDYSAQHIVDEELVFIGTLALETFIIALIMMVVFSIILNFFVLRPVNRIAQAANDYIAEGEELSSTNSITELHVETHDELQGLSESLKTMEAKMRSYAHHLKNAVFRAETDSMTGLLNREAFERKVEARLKACSFEGFSVFMMIDLDDFKNVNDTYGHTIGDEALVSCAQMLKSNFRSEDLVARMGGDEFAVFCSHFKSFEEIEQRMTKICAAARLIHVRHDVSISISVGSATFEGTTALSYQDLYSAADDTLYEAKAQGRDNYLVKNV